MAIEKQLLKQQAKQKSRDYRNCLSLVERWMVVSGCLIDGSHLISCCKCKMLVVWTTCWNVEISLRKFQIVYFLSFNPNRLMNPVLFSLSQICAFLHLFYYFRFSSVSFVITRLLLLLRSQSWHISFLHFNSILILIKTQKNNPL